MYQPKRVLQSLFKSKIISPSLTPYTLIIPLKFGDLGRFTQSFLFMHGLLTACAHIFVQKSFVNERYKEAGFCYRRQNGARKEAFFNSSLPGSI
jgi:hypothetical protein